MTNVPDDLFLGNPNMDASGFQFLPSSSDNPTAQQGVGPMGRIFYYNIVPLTLQTANAAVLAALTISVPMTLAAGTGATAGLAPDGSGRTVIIFDVPRAVSLTSTSNLSGLNVTVVGFDYRGNLNTSTRAGPNNNTVNTLKAFKSVLSVTPSATNAGTMSVGSSDIFGLPVVVADAGYITQAKWDNTLAANAGTLVVADATSPATAATGDVRGTYAQSGNASNGSRRLVLGIHLDSTQCGSSMQPAKVIGVTPF